MVNKSNGYVKDTTVDNVATITFSHPAHNSLPGHLLKKLADKITEVDKQEEVHVIILKSGGDRTFCAGASFDELTAINNPEEGKKFFMGFARVINACRKASTIIIGRIQGKAVGGGVGLTAAVDYAIANKYASIRLSELSLGIGPFVIGPAVERKIGKTNFAQLALTPNDWKTADWAQDKGLYQDVFPSNEKVDEYVNYLAAELASYNPEALKEMKSILWENTDNWDQLLSERAAMSGRLVLSEFTKNAISNIKSHA